MLEHYHEIDLESLSWNHTLASQSFSLNSPAILSGSDVLNEQPQAIRPGPKSYKRRIAEERGIPYILEDAEVSPSIHRLISELPELQPQSKTRRRSYTQRTSRPRQTNDDILSQTSSSSKSIVNSNILVKDVGAQNLSNIGNETDNSSSSVEAQIMNNDVDDAVLPIPTAVTAESSDDSVPGFNNSKNSYISMGAPRRIRKKYHYLHLI